MVSSFSTNYSGLPDYGVIKCTKENWSYKEDGQTNNTRQTFAHFIVQCLLLLFLKILPVYDDKYFLFVIHYVDVEKINEMKWNETCPKVHLTYDIMTYISMANNHFWVYTWNWRDSMRNNQFYTYLWKLNRHFCFPAVGKNNNIFCQGHIQGFLSVCVLAG